MIKIKMSESEATLDQLRPGPFQNRTVFESEGLAELARSIEEEGLINWPIVRRHNGHLEILMGERRWRALCGLALEARAGLEREEALALVSDPADVSFATTHRATLQLFRVPVRVAEGRAANLHHISLIENIQRENLNPVDEARGYQDLADEYGYSDHRIGQIVGKSGGHVGGRRKILELDEPLIELVAQGRLSKDAQAVRALLSVPDRQVRVELGRRFVARGTSIKGIVASCRRTVELLKQQKLARRPARTVPVGQVQLHRPAGPAAALCQPCRDQINALAEELCGECSVRGLSPECLHCPGVTEFLTGLLRLTGQGEDQ